MGGMFSSPTKHDPYSMTTRGTSAPASFQYDWSKGAAFAPKDSISTTEGAEEKADAASRRPAVVGGPSSAVRGRQVNEDVGTVEGREKAKSEWSKLRNANVAAAAMLDGGASPGKQLSRRQRRRRSAAAASKADKDGEEGDDARGKARRKPARGASMLGPTTLSPKAGRLAFQPVGMPDLPSRASSTLTFEHFEKVEIVGVGGLAQVQLMRPRSDKAQLYAVKIMHKREISRRKLIRYVRREVEVLTALAEAGAGSAAAEALARGEKPTLPAAVPSAVALDRDNSAGAASAEPLAPSPFFVTLRARVKDGARVGLVLDFAPGGDLYTRLRRVRCFPEAVARFYCAEILDALAFLHSRRIMFRDLKPENVLVDAQGHVRLTDFGFARYADSRGRCFTRLGTPHYQAPEQLDKRNKQGYTEAVDYWALACILFEMLTGKVCFGTGSDNAYEVFMKIMKGKTASIPLYVSTDARRLIKAMLVPDRAKRLCKPDTIRMHPWFASVDWQALRERRVQPPFVPRLDHGPATYFDRFTRAETAFVEGRKRRDKWTRDKGPAKSEQDHDEEGEKVDQETFTVNGKDPFSFF